MPIDPVSVFFWALAALMLGVVLSDLRHHRTHPVARAMVVVGLSCLLASALRAMVQPAFGWASAPVVEIVDAVVRLAGFGLLGGGLLWVGRQAYADAQIRHLQSRLHEADHQLRSTRGLLEGILRSCMTSIGVVSAVRDAGGAVRDFSVRLCNDDLRRWFPHAGGQREPLLSSADPSIPVGWLFGVLRGVVETGESFAGCHREGTIGGERWFEVVAVRHRDGACFTLADVTARRRAEEQLYAAARTDTLTRLPNRVHVKERLAHLIECARRDPSRLFAVMFLDFDGFKSVNDRLGHGVGDQLLVSIGERLRASLRAIDTVSGPAQHLPARIGGDEFVVLIEGLTREQDALIVADRLQHDLSAPHRIEGHEVVCTASIGIATSARGYADADAILRDADQAMYRAKTQGRGRTVVFDQAMHEDSERARLLESELREAVDLGLFVLEYQPVVSFETGRIVGFESLVRWDHPVRGLIPPERFLPLAQSIGLMPRIGRWVAERACRTLADLVAESGRSDLFVTINKSRAEILDPGVVEELLGMIGSAGLGPGNVVLEMTEHTASARLEDVLPVLRAVRERGVRVAIDDFGTGESSYATLHRLPVDMLKLDASFLRMPRSTRPAAAILQSMIDLAHNLGLHVVAEGVETREDLTLLQALGCDLGQGYLLGEPGPASVALAALAERTRRRLAA